jgi:hypothetical protein
MGWLGIPLGKPDHHDREHQRKMIGNTMKQGQITSLQEYHHPRRKQKSKHRGKKNLQQGIMHNITLTTANITVGSCYYITAVKLEPVL